MGPDGKRRRIDRDARRRALQQAWQAGAFRCHYTGVRLVVDPQRSRDRRYLEFEHQTPGDESSVVVTCALVNRMKTDLTDAQFRTLVRELAKTFDGGTFEERAFPDGALPGGSRP